MLHNGGLSDTGFADQYAPGARGSTGQGFQYVFQDGGPADDGRLGRGTGASVRRRTRGGRGSGKAAKGRLIIVWLHFETRFLSIQVLLFSAGTRPLEPVTGIAVAHQSRNRFPAVHE